MASGQSACEIEREDIRDAGLYKKEEQCEFMEHGESEAKPCAGLKKWGSVTMADNPLG